MSWLFGLGGQGQGGQIPPNLNLDIPGLPPPGDGSGGGGGGGGGATGGDGGGKGGGPTVPDFNSGGLERAAKAAKDLEQSSESSLLFVYDRCLYTVVLFACVYMIDCLVLVCCFILVFESCTTNSGRVGQKRDNYLALFDVLNSAHYYA